MKNLIIVTLLLLLVLLGIYVLKHEGINSVQDLTSSVKNAVNDTVASVKSKVEETLPLNNANVPTSMAELPADTALSIAFPAKAIAPAITHVSDFIVKVKTSSLGKKLEIDKMIDQGIQAAESGANSVGENSLDLENGDSGNIEQPEMNTSSKQPSFDEILKTIQNFEKLEVLVRAKTLEGKATPLLKINASFKDDLYGKQLQEMLEGFMEMSQQGPGPQLKKDEQDPLTYVLNVKPPLAPVEILARIKPAGKDLSATIGVIAGTVSATATKNTTATDSIIAQSSISKESFGTYINVDNFRSLIDVFLNLMPKEESNDQITAARKALDSSLGEYSAIAFTSIFDKGFNAKSCSRFSPGGNSFSTFKSAIESAENNKSNFFKLISPKTTFAVRIDGSFAGASTETMLKTFGNSAALAGNSALSGDPEATAATEQMLSQLKVAEEEIKKLKITDIGLVANAPSVSFVPDIGVYIEHQAGISIEQFAEVLQTLFKKLAPPSIAENSPIAINKDSKGETQIIIPAMEGYQLTFRAISPTQIFGSIQDSFSEEAKNLLQAKDSFIDDSKLSAKGVNLKISDNDNFYYISTSSLMPLVRQFAPFITMSKPELKISDTELTQFLDLLDFNVLVTGKNSTPEDLTLCTSGQAVVY